MRQTCGAAQQHLSNHVGLIMFTIFENKNFLSFVDSDYTLALLYSFIEWPYNEL